MKIKWSIDEMIAMCVQEEERLKAEKIEYVGQFQASQKWQYKRFVKEYMKPKNSQFKEFLWQAWTLPEGLYWFSKVA